MCFIVILSRQKLQVQHDNVACKTVHKDTPSNSTQSKTDKYGTLLILFSSVTSSEHHRLRELLKQGKDHEINKVHWTRIRLKMKLSTDQKYFRHLWVRWKTGNPFVYLPSVLRIKRQTAKKYWKRKIELKTSVIVSLRTNYVHLM